MNAGMPPIGHYLARLLSRHGEPIAEDVRALLHELCDAVLKHHSCLELSGVAETTRRRLESLGCVGAGDDNVPLVLHGDRLYLQRCFAWEKGVATLLTRRNRAQPCGRRERFREGLDALFPRRRAAARQAVDFQRVAALQALTRQLLIVTGGPGTGKTRSAVKIIALLSELSEGEPVIRFAAPTGKAVMRLKDSIHDGLAELPRSWSFPEVQGATLHRLLGLRADGRSWSHDASNPVDADVLIVDEASMIDLPMAYRLLSALSPDTRLILLGDADQLPSIHVGNVMADLCREPTGYSESFSKSARELVHGELPVAARGHALVDAICRFERNYRFVKDSGIGRLTRNVRAGTAAFGPDENGVHFRNVADLQDGGLEQLLPAFFDDYLRLLASQQVPRAAALLKVFEQTRILCAQREGPLGVVNVNRLFETLFEQRGLKQRGQTFYTGKPVMVTRNDYNLNLFNGDLGICVPGREQGLRVAFPDAQGNLQHTSTLRLSHQETCFAMTVHKSQGSEFDHVVLILDRFSASSSGQLQMRELLYTAITRARRRITIYSTPDTWEQTLKTTSTRTSGLQELLAEARDRHGRD